MDLEKYQYVGNNKKFNPISLFKNGEQGVWYDPSDINRYMSNLGPELVSNGTFENTTGWTPVIGTISAVDGKLRVARSVDNIGRASFQFNCVIGRNYYVSLERNKAQTGSTQCIIAITHSSSVGNIYANNSTTDGLFTFGFTATQTSHWLFVEAGSGTGGQYAEYDNVSIKEIINDTIGTELITNGDFSSDGTGWTDVSTAPAYIDYSGTGAVLISNSNTARLRKSLSTTIGKSYIVTVTHNTVNTVARFSIGYTGGSSELLPATAINTGVTTYTFVAGTSETWFNWFSSGTPNLEITSLSVKEITTSNQSITMFQDALGTIPVDGVEEPVGLILDKSKGLTIGPNLYTGGNITGVPIGGPAFTNYPLGFNVVAGKTYRVSIDVTNYSGTNTYSVGGVTGTDWVFLNPQTGNRKWEFTVMALTNTAFALFTRSTNTANFSNISVKEIAGIPAYQTTAIDRPILKRGITNLQLQSNTYSNAVWVLNNCTQAIATGQFIDGVQATTLTVSANGVIYAAGTTLNSVAGVTYTIATYVRQGTARYVQLTVPSNIAGTNQWANFDLQTGTVSFSQGGTASIMAVSGGYIICWSAVATANITNQSYTAAVIVDWGGAGRAPNITGMIGQTILIATTGVFVGAYTAQEIQNKYGGIPITTSTTANTRLGEWYLSCNGSNTWMRTNNVDFSATDKITGFIGARILSGTGMQLFLETSTNYASNNGAFELSLNEVSSGKIIPAYKAAAGTQYVISTPNTVPRSTVTTFAFNTTLTTVNGGVTIREQGVATATSPVGASTGTTFGNYPLYLFRRAGVSLPFNGNIYGLIIRGALSTNKQIQDCEKYLTKKLG